MNLKPSIDSTKCTACAKCVEICPKDVLFINGKSVSVNDNECMLCSHCYAVCFFDAIFFKDILKKKDSFSFNYNEKIYMPDDFTPSEIINILKSRRSIRKFTKDPLSDKSMRDLIEFASTAPSGSNLQEWAFTVLNGREKVWDFALLLKGFFKRLNKLAANPIIRFLSLFFMGKALVNYYRDHYDTVQMAIEKSENGEDVLFHNAPSLIIVHGAMGGSTPIEDGTYAAYNICILAHYIKLGTCLIGFAVEAINRDKSLKKYLKIPEKNRVHAVIAIGKPDVKFYKHSLRKEYSVNFL